MKVESNLANDEYGDESEYAKDHSECNESVDKDNLPSDCENEDS